MVGIARRPIGAIARHAGAVGDVATVGLQAGIREYRGIAIVVGQIERYDVNEEWAPCRDLAKVRSTWFAGKAAARSMRANLMTSSAGTRFLAKRPFVELGMGSDIPLPLI